MQPTRDRQHDGAPTGGPAGGAEETSATAAARRFPLVYAELRALAGACMRGQPGRHTLQPTALVHEAYLRMSAAHAEWTDRAHFLAVAATAMRQILVNHALAKATRKRGGGRRRVALEAVDPASPQGAPDPDVIELHEAIERLSAMHERMARVVEGRFFGGMTNAELAQVLGVSLSTIEADWRTARAWLTTELAPDGGRATAPKETAP